MGNVLGCSSSRNKVKKALECQEKLQEILEDISLQEYEIYFKKFSNGGCLSVK